LGINAFPFKPNVGLALGEMEWPINFPIRGNTGVGLFGTHYFGMGWRRIGGI